MKLTEHYGNGSGANVAGNVEEVCVSVASDGLLVTVEYWNENGKKTTRHINSAEQACDQITIADDTLEGSNL